MKRTTEPATTKEGEGVTNMSDPTSEGGMRQTVEFENSRVRVVRYHFAPHARVPMHDALDVVAIWLTDTHLKLTFPDGTIRQEVHKAGETAWASAQKHAGENVADTPLEFVAVQLKSNSAGSEPQGSL